MNFTNIIILNKFNLNIYNISTLPSMEDKVYTLTCGSNPLDGVTLYQV